MFSIRHQLTSARHHRSQHPRAPVSHPVFSSLLSHVLTPGTLSVRPLAPSDTHSCNRHRNRSPSPFTVYYPPFTVHCPLFYHLLIPDYCLSSPIYCLLSPFMGHCPLHSIISVYYHRLPFTISSGPTLFLPRCFCCPHLCRHNCFCLPNCFLSAQLFCRPRLFLSTRPLLLASLFLFTVTVYYPCSPFTVLFRQVS